MTENMKMFLEKVSTDKALMEKLNELDKNGIIAAAKERGFELTEADLAHPGGEMSADELEVVSGGGICACVTAGGGKRDEENNQDACGCVTYGGGTGGPIDKTRCICYIGGYGSEKAP